MILSGKTPESIRNEIESDLSRRINEFFLTAGYNTFNNSKCQPSSHSTDDFFSFTHFYFFNFISKFSQLASRNIVTKIIVLDSNVDSLLIRHLSAYEKRSIFQRLVDPEIKLAVHHLKIQMRQKERYGVTTIKSFLR